jgi:predicted nucleotidyltransferase
MNLDSKLILETLKNNLNRVPHVHLAIIYGSTVSGTLTSSSDIDLAIATGKKITFKEKIEIFLRFTPSETNIYIICI